LEIHQLLGHVGPFLQPGIRLFQAIDFLVARIGRLATGLAGGQAGLTVLGQLFAPGRQLAGVQALAAQPATLFTVR
jgi:hypothetical protein